MDDIAPVKLLGKGPKKEDHRNLMAARYLASEFPARYAWQKGRRPVPARSFGNTSYGDCTLASQANCVIRFERTEQRRTVLIPDQTVIRNYLDMTGGQDAGYFELDAIKRWRTTGFDMPRDRFYRIDGFAEVNPKNIDEVKAALFQHGLIKVCFALPIAWAGIDPPTYAADGIGGIWDVGVGSTFEPYSWGGHSLMADMYDERGLWVSHTWYDGPVAARQLVTWEAVQQYCDEAYSIVDSFNFWHQRNALFDIGALQRDVEAVTSA